MRHWYLVIAVYFMYTAAAAQDTAHITVSMDEVIIKSTADEKFNHHPRLQNVHMLLNPGKVKEHRDVYQNTYFLTKLPPLEQQAVYLHAAELRLHSFDTSLFDIRLMILQLKPDTICTIIPLNAAAIKNNRLKVDLINEQITLQPDSFYMGYGFRPRNITSPYRYKMYATTKGQGAILTFIDKQMHLVYNDGDFPYVFPFILSYRKL